MGSIEKTKKQESPLFVLHQCRIGGNTLADIETRRQYFDSLKSATQGNSVGS